MQSGPTLYVPSIEAEMPYSIEDMETKMGPTVQKNLAMLDMAWSLPALKASHFDQEAQSVANMSVATEGEQQW
jgi:hypothetical protein